MITGKRMTHYNRSHLENLGFVGWKPWADIANWGCPTTGGVYVVQYACQGLPEFLSESPAGWFKAKDPSVAIDALRANWVEAVDIIYIGKANNLRRRLQQYARFGSGRPVAHWGGRLIWQLPNRHTMQSAWRETPGDNPREVERQMIEDFRLSYGKPPFANEPHRLGR